MSVFTRSHDSSTTRRSGALQIAEFTLQQRERGNLRLKPGRPLGESGQFRGCTRRRRDSAPVGQLVMHSPHCTQLD